MILHVMRHGPAEDRAPSGRDVDRRLTVEGRAVVARVAATFMGSIAEPVRRIISSPAIRALETAEIVRVAPSMHGQAPSIEPRDDLGPSIEAPPFDLVRELASRGVVAMLVGHQPWVEDLVRNLARDSSRLRGVRTATVVTLVPIEGAWQITSVLDPAKLH